MPTKKGNQYGKATQFKKGQSGNPGGCPKIKQDDRDALAVLEGGKVAAAQLLVACVNGKRVSAYAWRSAVEILNRVYGRPREMIEVKADIPSFVALLPAKIEDGDIWEAQAQKVLSGPSEH